MLKNKLYSVKISAGSRNYRLDIKTSVNNANYLVINEIRDNFKTKQIIIFEEYLYIFYKGLKNALKFVEQKRYVNAYSKWTQRDDDRLISLYSHNIKIKEIANIFKRKPNAIRSRLKKLGKLGLL